MKLLRMIKKVFWGFVNVCKVIALFFLAITWELPQTLLAVGVLAIKGRKFSSVSAHKTALIIYLNNVRFGVSLGRIIIIDSDYKGHTIIEHEHGHSLQSLMLAWLYLPIVGISSGARNLWFRTHKKSILGKGYYDAFPENWADKLGGVVR